MKIIMDKNNNNNIINIDNNDELLEPWGYYLVSIILFLIGFFGFTLNLFVIMFMCKDIQLWTPMNIILFNLVCSDFLVSIFGNPFTFIAALSHKWIFGNLLCIAYGFFMALFGITSITTLTVLAYERYYLVKHPLTSRKIRNRGAVISVLFIWIYSLALTTPPLFGWGAYVNEAADISCSVNWETQTLNATSYIIYLFIFGFLLPVIIISFSYINIIITMKKNSLRLGRKSRGEKHITCMVAIMIFAFMTAWTPYATFALIEQFGPSDLITPQLAVIPAIIAKSSICYNPLIYVGMNTQFRASWKRYLTKDTTIIDTTTNKISQTNESMVIVDCGPIMIRQNKKEKKCMKITSKTDDNQINNKENSNENLLNNIIDKMKCNSNYKSSSLRDLNSQLFNALTENHIFENTNNNFMKRSMSLSSFLAKNKDISENNEDHLLNNVQTANFLNTNANNSVNKSVDISDSKIIRHDITVISEGNQMKTLIDNDLYL